MAETQKIAEIAEKISKELFFEFFWQRTGTVNTNWDCEKQEQHGVKTHPSDVVFYYDEPYELQRTYVNCDLKSYATSSITSAAIKNAVESLAKQISCAEVSELWRKKYIHDGVTPSICGLLFVYNHDGEFDKDFRSRLVSVQAAKLDIPKGGRLFILGPEEINWLDNVRYEIRQMRGSSGAERLPDREHCKFFYPQLMRKKNKQLELVKAASLEMLTSPLLVLEYEKAETGKKGYVLFYKGKGETPQEFTYLIDYLRHFQLLHEDINIQIKLLHADVHAQTMFKKAVQDYIEEISAPGQRPALAECIAAIKYERITQVLTKFSELDLGMDHD